MCFLICSNVRNTNFLIFGELSALLHVIWITTGDRNLIAATGQVAEELTLRIEQKKAIPAHHPGRRPLNSQPATHWRSGTGDRGQTLGWILAELKKMGK